MNMETRERLGFVIRMFVGVGWSWVIIRLVATAWSGWDMYGGKVMLVVVGFGLMWMSWHYIITKLFRRD